MLHQDDATIHGRCRRTLCILYISFYSLLEFVLQTEVKISLLRAQDKHFLSSTIVTMTARICTSYVTLSVNKAILYIVMAYIDHEK